MREYQPIWIRIKTKNSASIVAPIELHKRIIKAVIKEKYMDVAFKTEQKSKSLRSKLIISVDSNDKTRINFSLYTEFEIRYIKVTNL